MTESYETPARRMVDEDAAVTLAVLALLTATDTGPSTETRSAWGDPAHRLRITSVGPVGWWRSGLPS